MKKHNKTAIVIIAVLALLATSFTAFAYAAGSPAEILSGLTGRSAEEISNEKVQSGTTYGQIAYDEELWEEFRTEMLESKKAFLDEKVADGTLTQEQADTIYENMQLRQQNCTANGTGGGFGGGMMGLGYGGGRGCGGGRNWQ